MFFHRTMMFRTKEVINDKMFVNEIANLKNLSPEVNYIAIQRQLYILLRFLIYLKHFNLTMIAFLQTESIVIISYLCKVRCKNFIMKI